MKQYFCCYGHLFNMDEVKEWMGYNEYPICPFCWPIGYRKYQIGNRWGWIE